MTQAAFTRRTTIDWLCHTTPCVYISLFCEQRHWSLDKMKNEPLTKQWSVEELFVDCSIVRRERVKIAERDWRRRVRAVSADPQWTLVDQWNGIRLLSLIGFDGVEKDRLCNWLNLFWLMMKEKWMSLLMSRRQRVDPSSIFVCPQWILCEKKNFACRRRKSISLKINRIWPTWKAKEEICLG